MDQERAGGNPGLRKFTDVAVWAQEDLRTKEAFPSHNNQSRKGGEVKKLRLPTEAGAHLDWAARR